MKEQAELAVSSFRGRQRYTQTDDETGLRWHWEMPHSQCEVWAATHHFYTIIFNYFHYFYTTNIIFVHQMKHPLGKQSKGSLSLVFVFKSLSIETRCNSIKRGKVSQVQLSMGVLRKGKGWSSQQGQSRGGKGELGGQGQREWMFRRARKLEVSGGWQVHGAWGCVMEKGKSFMRTKHLAAAGNKERRLRYFT